MFNMNESNKNVMKYHCSMFPMIDIWALKNLEGYQLWQLFEKINF